MEFKYTVFDQQGNAHEGSIEAATQDIAITSLQRRGLVVSSIEAVSESNWLSFDISFLSRVSNKDVVILSRQVATLFEAQVSALRVFRLLAEETPNATLQNALVSIADDLQAGTSISKALSKYPDIFSSFYINMVRTGEETGKLDQIFLYLADYLDRTYEVTSKARNALIYPAFVIFVFIVVMVLMLTFVIPRIGAIFQDAGQQIPIYTRIVLGISNFVSTYGIFILIAMVVGGVALWRYSRTGEGKYSLDAYKLSIPYIGQLYRKLYLSRIADNLSTMLAAGVPMIRSIEVTADVVDNAVYRRILQAALDDIKNGVPISKAFGTHPEMPGIMVQMIRVGEETGELGSILNMLAKFYQREVTTAVDTLIDLIEPAMIVLLAGAVGVLLASVLVPIYNISSAI